MDLLIALQQNKGTISSALGKELAGYVLSGDMEILNRAIELTTYQLTEVSSKSVRAGAAKIVEIVAEKQPAWVADHLPALIPALTVQEPQTKWMILRTAGFCAKLNPDVARRCMPYAIECLRVRQGLCLSSSAVLYMGDLGALSDEDARTVYPHIRQEMMNPVKNQEAWILEAFMAMAHHLMPWRDEVIHFAEQCRSLGRKAIDKRIEKLKKKLQG